MKNIEFFLEHFENKGLSFAFPYGSQDERDAVHARWMEVHAESATGGSVFGETPLRDRFFSDSWEAYNEHCEREKFFQSISEEKLALLRRFNPGFDKQMQELASYWRMSQKAILGKLIEETPGLGELVEDSAPDFDFFYNTRLDGKRLGTFYVEALREADAPQQFPVPEAQFPLDTKYILQHRVRGEQEEPQHAAWKSVKDIEKLNLATAELFFEWRDQFGDRKPFGMFCNPEPESLFNVVDSSVLNDHTDTELVLEYRTVYAEYDGIFGLSLREPEIFDERTVNELKEYEERMKNITARRKKQYADTKDIYTVEELAHYLDSHLEARGVLTTLVGHSFSLFPVRGLLH